MIKKVLLPILLIMIFFCSPNKVQAVSGDYVYDITIAKAESTYLKLRGWAVINKNGEDVHNINPKFTMKLVGKNQTQTTIIKESAIINNELESGRLKSYAKCSDLAYDYTKMYYTKSGNYVYPDITNSSEKTKCNQSPVDTRVAMIKDNPTYGNEFAINVNFEFHIPYTYFSDLYKAGARAMLMELTSELDGATYTIYGEPINNGSENRKDGNGDSIGQKFHQTFAIAIQQDRIADSTKSIKLEGIGRLELKQIVNQVTSAAENGQGRPYADPNSDIYYYLNNGILEGHTRNEAAQYGYTTTYYYNKRDHGATLATYTVPSGGAIQTTLNSANKNNEDYIYTYKINVSRGGACYSGYCLKDGGSKEAYLTSFWTTPIPGVYTFGEIVPACDKDPECATAKLGNGTKCPKDGCCTDVCKLAANKNSHFCTQVCKLVPVTPSCDDPDPAKKYCCKYPSDPLCSLPVGDETTYPETNPNDAKSGTCSGYSSTSMRFKYPAEGWGKITLPKNTACTVSCQETLKTTFLPSVSLRAGMGYDYPISVNGTRICTAAYTNDTWKTAMDNAVAKAKQYYDEMKSYLQSANTKATTCGSKQTTSYTIPYAEYTATGKNNCSGCGCKTKSCSPKSCTQCDSNHDYTSFSAYALGPTYDIYNVVAYAEKSLNAARGYNYQTSNMYPLNSYGNITTSETTTECSPSTSALALADNRRLAETTTPPKPPCICNGCNTTHCSRTCPAKTCTQYKCSSSGAWWDTGQSAVDSDLSKARAAKDNYDAQKAIIDKLNADRTTCDNWVRDNDYQPVNANIDVNYVNGGPNDVQDQDAYELTSNKKTETNYKTLTNNYVISFCNYGSHGVSKSSYNKFSMGLFDRGSYCLSTYTQTKTYNDYWVKISKRDIKYSFDKDYYIEKYTGKPALNKANNDAYVHDGRYEYTDFFTKSGTYDFGLSARTLGPNIPGVSNSAWSVNPFTCRYDLNNLIFPPEGDPNNALYGNVTYMYRQISLTDPFPGRSPGENWNGKVSLITAKHYTIYGMTPLYRMSLTPPIMQTIRGFGTDYTTYNPINPDISTILDTYIRNGTIVRRK